MWEIYIVPKPPQNTFPDELIQNAKLWWERYPTYAQTNGLIRLAESFEYRDSILASGRRDLMFEMLEAIRIVPEKIMLGFAAQSDTPELRLLLDFADWVREQCEIEMFDEGQNPVGVDQLRRELKIPLPD